MQTFISSADMLALWLTFQLAAVSTLILLLISIPIAWWLARTRNWIKPYIETLIAMPLVLPPTVVGFYLLVAFSPETALAKAWEALTGSQLAFSFSGLVLGSVIYSLPFVVQPLQASFEKVSRTVLLTAASLGAKPVDVFFSIIAPMCSRTLLAAATLAFSHTIGEFGIVLMIGGNIPGETQVLSIALFDHVESLDYRSAHKLALLLLGISFVSLLTIYGASHRDSVRLIRVKS